MYLFTGAKWEPWAWKIIEQGKQVFIYISVETKLDSGLLDHKRDEENRKPCFSWRWNSITAQNSLALRKVILTDGCYFCPWPQQKLLTTPLTFLECISWFLALTYSVEPPLFKHVAWLMSPLLWLYRGKSLLLDMARATVCKGRYN